MNIDERIEALTINLELLSHEVRDLRSAITDLHGVTQQDAENIRALVRIAEIHERRLTHLEGGE
jgi:prefoldin subunit 5